jgi:hypothetical protein
MNFTGALILACTSVRSVHHGPVEILHQLSLT